MYNLILSFGFKIMQLILLLLVINCASITSEFANSKNESEPNSQQPSRQENPKTVEEILRSGNDDFYSGKFKEAIEKANEANSIRPSEDGFYLLGNSLYKYQDFINAKIAFENGLELNPRSEPLLAAHAINLTTLGEEAKAVEIYNKLTEYFPDKEFYSFRRAVSLKSLKLYKESLLEFQKINSESFRYKPQLFIHLGDVCFNLQKYSLAIDYYKRASDIDESQIEAANGIHKAKFAFEMESGQKAFTEKKYQNAIQSFSKAIELDKTNSFAYYSLGKSYFQNTQFLLAEENLKKSLSFDSKNREAYILLSTLYNKNEKYQNSIQILEKGIENFPNAIEFFDQLATSYKLSGKSKLAMLTWMNAKDIDKSNLMIRKNLAILFLEEGQVYEAYQEIKELHSLDANDKFAREALEGIESIDKIDTSAKRFKAWKEKRKMAKGREYEDKKEWEKAERYYKEILIKNPEDEFSRNRLSIVQITKSEEENKKKQREFLENEKGDILFHSGKISQAIEEYHKSFSAKPISKTLTKICNTYFELGKKENCLNFIQGVWKNLKEYNPDLPETIATLFLKLGQEKTAITAFKKILEKNPESYFSHYQLGVLELNRDRRYALLNFDKAIALNPKYSSAYIARGITYYKSGNRERARDDFHYALSIESNLEIASYNLGMILYNDNLHKDAESIFLELTQKYPNFSDPYYHLGYMYFEQKKFSLAEKYILISLELDRNPTTIYAYVKILEELKKTNAKKENINERLVKLKREIVGKYPDSSYAKKLTDSVLRSSENNVVIQSYPLSDSLVSPPIFVNQSIIVNYGTSIARLNSETKSMIWKVETNIPYKLLKAKTRLYGLSKNTLDQFDLETGKKIWSLNVRTENFNLSDSILYSEIDSGKEILYSYSIEGDFQSKLELDNESKWMLAVSGALFVFHNLNDSLSWEIYDSRLNLIKTSQTLIGLEKGSISLLGSIEDSVYLLKGNNIYRYEANGNFAKSARFEISNSFIYIFKNKLYIRTDTEHYSLNDKLNKERIQDTKNQDLDILVDENTYLTSGGTLKIKDISGKTLWSENLKERSSKNKTGVYSIYMNRQE